MISTRRHFFFGSLALSLPVFAAKEPPERPSLVLILADGLPAWVLGSHGNKEFRTPHLDRLAQMGTRFAKHFAAAPDAGVNRGTLLTGRTPMQLGESANLPAAEISLEKLLSSQGYACQTTDIAGAARFLDAPPAGKPFCLTVNLTPLRPPYNGMPQKYYDLYAQARFDTINPEGPDAVSTLRKAGAAITALDDDVQSIVSRLIRGKLLDRTLLLFTSTCGDLLSHHGQWSAAGSFYEEAVGTPMFWIWHGRVPAQAVRPELISAYDLVPTLCETLTIDPPARNLCGRSYMLLATGKPLPRNSPWRTTVFGHYKNAGMARIARHKLVLRDGGPSELYGLIADPWEKVNQYDNPQFVTVRNALTAELNAWKQRYSV